MDRVFARRARLVHCHNTHPGNNFGRPIQRGSENRPPKTPKSPSSGTILHRRHRAAAQNATQTIESGAAYFQTLPTPIINLRSPINNSPRCRCAETCVSRLATASRRGEL
jgi:hypothetical protein